MKQEEKSIAKLIILIAMGSFAVSYFATSNLRIATEQNKESQVALNR